MNGMKHKGESRRLTCLWVMVCVVAWACVVWSAMADVSEVEGGVEAPWRFRLGPFLEFGCDAEGTHTSAIRPLFSHVADADAHVIEQACLWPLATRQRRDDRLRWRAGFVWGMDADIHDPTSRDSFWLFPIYTHGHTVKGHDDLAIFPFYGRFDQFMGMQDLTFVLFPFYSRFRAGDRMRTYTPWPFYREEAQDDGDIRLSIFPFYGSSTSSEQTGSYCLWPFWTEQVFHGQGRTGSAQMLFPFYARIDTNQERGWMLLPPLIGYSENPEKALSRLRAPWPFIQMERDQTAHRRTYWPFWGEKHAGDRQSWYALWPLLGGSQVTSRTQFFTSTHIVPFYYSETRTQRRGEEILHEKSYHRIWPFYSYRKDGACSRLRLVELWPLQHGGSIERNWASFWSWYVEETRGEARDHDLLWGLARWGVDGTGGRYGQVAGLFSWRHAPDGERTWYWGGCAPGVPPGGGPLKKKECERDNP